MVGHTSSQNGTIMTSVATLTTEFQITVYQELHEMGSHGRAASNSLSSSCAMPSVGWSGVKLGTIGLWSSGKGFSGVMNHTSPSGSPMD